MADVVGPAVTGSVDLTAQALRLVTDGTATSRSGLASELGVSAATASSLVRRLLRDGLLEEEGPGSSSGGRRPMLLRPRVRAGHLAVAELGGRHARVGLCDGAGALLVSTDVDLEIEAGVEPVLAVLARGWDGLLAGRPDLGPRLGVGLALPGPVDAERGEVVSPARMPGWHGLAVRRIVEDVLGVPAVVENDARAGGLGEWAVREDAPEQLLYVKAGTGIGSAWIGGGRIHRGADGLAGDVTHTKVSGAEELLCSCGNRGCLETVASGAAVRRDLATEGFDAPSLAGLVALAVDSDPLVTTRLRTAGMRLGEVLAPLVNFLNPDVVVLGGALSAVDGFVAGVRGEIYDRCLPMCSEHLVIERAAAGAAASLHGLGLLLQDRLAAAASAPHLP